jgi:hypothetical protein
LLADFDEQLDSLIDIERSNKKSIRQLQKNLEKEEMQKFNKIVDSSRELLALEERMDH